MTLPALTRDIFLIGSARFEKETHAVFVKVLTGLDVELFGTNLDIYYRHAIPLRIDCQIEGWKISIKYSTNVKYRGIYRLQQLAKDFDLPAEVISSAFTVDSTSLCWHMSVRPGTIDFTKVNFEDCVPEEFGIVIYPDGPEKAIYGLLHEGTRDPRDLPSIFAGVDSSICIKNRQEWTLQFMKERLHLITKALVLFAGAPLTYTSVVGRCSDEVAFVRANLISEPTSFICPAPYSGHVAIRNDAAIRFREMFGEIIDRIYSGPARERTVIALSYYQELYTALYDETRIAFSFQLMEALANYAGMPIKHHQKNDIRKNLLRKYSKSLCATCLSLISKDLQPDSEAFDGFIKRALAAALPSNQNILTADAIKQIARQYRHQVFHGNFFEDMTEIDKIVNDLPENYRTDLVEILQAVVSILGAYFLLNLDFDMLSSGKRRN